ncbi:unnamed protein product [Caenorhabditis bovis]|uniref:Eukaryotic translation initiation factor 5B n=1 Tax=Caenorhabditis bovis TaxID=2654633 RepID=A0A8S1ENL4_9PELO|nr:unnamed protein product [Caenorhabditis bovis]
MPPKKGGKKNKNDDDWDDEAAERKLAALKLAEQSETQWDDEPPKPKGKAKAPAKKGFAAMMMDDDSDQEKPISDDEPEPEPTPEPKVVEEKKPKKEKKEKGKKGKKGKQADDDDDLDAILASIESKDAPVPAAPPVATSKSDEKEASPNVDEPEPEDKKGKKKKKGKKGGNDEPSEVNEITAKPTEDSVKAPSEEKEEEKEEEDGSDNDEEGGKGKKDKKKQKKKDKKKEKEKKEKEEKKGKKGASGVSLIKEMLKKQQEIREEQERLAREEQERIEKLEKEREEQERIAREKKEAAKEAKRLEIERQKAAGTYMTAKQRKEQQIALEKLKAAGLNIPTVREAPADDTQKKGSFVYMDEKTRQKLEEKKRRRLEKQGLIAPETKQDAPPVEKVETSVEEEKTPESTPDKEEPLDDWEMADEVVEEPTKPAKEDVKQVKAEEESDDDEESDEDEEEESSEESDSDSEEEEEEDSSDSDAEVGKGKETKEQLMERIRSRIAKRREAAQAKRTTDDLRSPVICVLGHVDTGKTKMLDTIRRTNVQGGEAGGITQQIGATEVPADAIKERCRQVKDFKADLMKIPGFLIIDTPGHESFSNLRTRGSSLCDFAILVVDIMHGLEPQTIESLKLLIKGNTPFVVALNKIDRLYEYESNPRKDVYELLKSQKQRVQQEFKERYEKIVVEFAEQGINVTLSNKQKDDDFVCMVPTSAALGDGVGNLMAFIVNQTQTKYAEKLAYCEELDATVMEVKAIPGLGTTIDVILVNGRMRTGDVIVLTGADGAIVTQIRELLMPQPLREMRVKNEYKHYKEIRGARGVKVLAKNLEKALAGLPMFITDREDEIDYLRAEADEQLKNALHDIKKKPIGVYVMASTLGSLEALLDFLKSQKIPYSNVNIGPVHKRDVQKASAMKEHKAEYACILAFDVKVERDAQIFADNEGVKIFQADIIYHLQDSFLKYREELAEKARRENEHLAIFPCKLRILPNHVYNARNPIVCGVSVEAGQVKRGTPICVPSKEGILLGTVSSIERNGEEVVLAKQGDEVCIKIENTTGEAPRLYGRHFTHEDTLVSKISRESIDVCKTYFRDDLSKADWQLIVQLKKVLDIIHRKPSVQAAHQPTMNVYSVLIFVAIAIATVSAHGRPYCRRRPGTGAGRPE